MVHGAGTDKEYAQDIPIRVSHLETSVNQLHVDNQRTQNTLSGIVAQQEAQGRLLADIADKLDKTRTSRPELGSMATAATVILIIGAMAFAPVYREMDKSADLHEIFAGTLEDRSSIIAESVARIRYIERQTDSLETRMLGVESNRFSKQDGQRLEEQLRAEIARLKPNSGQSQ